MSRSLEQLEQQLSLRQRAQEVVRAQASAGYGDDNLAPRFPEHRDTFWGKNDPTASVERFTREFQALKAEMLNSNLARQDHIREQVGSDLRREFEVLRGELERTYSTANERTSAQLDSEIKRLGKAILQSRERSDDKGVNLLRLEIEQIKTSVANLAREDSVRAIGERWDEFERRMVQPNFDQAIDALSARLDQISAAVGTLPEQLSIDRVEDRLRNLAQLIEHFVQRETDRDHPEAIAAIEGRLEEISRSIVAISLADQKNAFDPAMIDRLDTRILALARQIEDASSESDAAILERLDVMANKIEALAETAPSATEEVSRELGKLNKKLSAAATPADFEKSLVQLEKRIIDIADRIEAQAAGDEAILGLQQRLDALNDKMDVNQSEVLDPALIRALEAQLAALSDHLEKPNPAVAGLAELAPRLERIEAAVSGSRDELVETARLAAEEVLRNFAGSPVEEAAIAGLTDDLKALESLTRDADDRNTRTFDAIHETLIKIIDRIGQLDLSEQHIYREDAPLALAEQEEEIEMPKVDVGQAPSIDMDDVPPIDEESTSFEFNFEPLPTPAQAVSENTKGKAAAPEEEDVETLVDEEQPSSGVSKWKRIFGRKDDVTAKKETETGALDDDDEDAPSGRFELSDADDDSGENTPLEPGKVPDLNALMRRVQDDRSDPELESEGDAARSDFIAAARRAAHAAAAEADLMKRSTSGEKPARKSLLASILRGRNRTMLLAAAAVMAALAGLQLGKAFVKDPVEISQSGAKPAAPEAAKLLDQTETGSIGKAKVTAPEPAIEQPAKPAAKPETPAVKPGAQAMPPDERGASASAEPAAITTTASPALDVPAQIGPDALREAAMSDDPTAVYVVGSRLAEGAGLSSNMQEAAKWFEKSAELGLAPAQYRIGNLYEKGIGVDRDIEKARYWYRLAANQGNANAMHNLAVLYATGGDISPDNEAAVRWFTKAAMLGVKDSQYNLGILAAKGAGMTQDMEQAYKWFGLVANTGDRDAADKRDEIAKAMTPAQIAGAQSAIATWRAETPEAAVNDVSIPGEWQEAATTTTAKVDMGKAIRNVQALLNKAGYDVGMADGLIGDKTRQAIAAFQEDHGLQPTGRIDESMVRALLAKN
ncbi:MAG: peptidoglycan-binding protein [Rhizobiaceae bacterium]|nr:peptidoglycan-binding protein [Rhizobiaceae bacterium]